MTAARTPVDVTRLIDERPAGGHQRLLVALTALAVIFDGVDNQLLGITLPAIIGEWGVARAAFAPVVALGFAGMMVGGAAAGIAGDRWGRRTALLGCMALFGSATLAVAAAPSVAALGVLRFVAGIGLGGAMPNAAALAAEYVPARRRAMAVTLTIVCIPVGGTLAGLIAIPLLPALGWRGLFAVGGLLPMLTAVVLRRVLAESPRYLARHPERWPELRRLLGRMGRPVDEEAALTDGGGRTGGYASPAELFTAARRRDTIALWCSFSSCLLAVYLGFSWLPAILSSAGLGPTVASGGILVFNLGGVAGAVAGGALIGRWGSRVPMLVMTGGAIAGAAALSRVPLGPGSVPLTLALLAWTGGLINAVQTTMYALAAHVYPTSLRATGVGAAAAIGRGGAILSGYAGPWALALSGTESFFLLMAASLGVTLGGLALVRRHVAARPA